MRRAWKYSKDVLIALLLLGPLFCTSNSGYQLAALVKLYLPRFLLFCLLERYWLFVCVYVTVSFSIKQKTDNTDLSESGHGLWLAVETSASLRTRF